MKLLPFVVSASVTSALVAMAASCSNSAGSGSALGGNIMMAPDGALYEVTEGGGMLPVTIGPDGAITTYPDQYVPPPEPDGSTGSTSTGDDASVSSGEDGAVSSEKDGGMSSAKDSGGSSQSDAMSSGCSDAGPPPPNDCSATVASGAIALTSNYLPAANLGVGMGGYAYSYSDSQNGVGGTTTICLDSSALCAMGTTDTNAVSAHYGAGIGFNINQAQATSCASTPIDALTISSSAVGISYSLSNLPPGGVRLAIGNFTSGTAGPGNEDYCVSLSAASGTIPWAAFNTQCWSNTGTFLTGPPTAPTHIEFGLPSSTSSESFNFCVESVGFPTSLPKSDAGTTTSCSGGTSCCEPSSGPSSSNGELTCYTFDQAGSPPVSANHYKSFCGYPVTESAGPGGGSGLCQSGALNFVDTVTANIGTNSQYFVAFPTGNGGWGQGEYCGMCVNVTYAGVTLMATVVDECPSGSCPTNGGHLDLNASLARALGLGVQNGGTTTTGDATSGVTWSAVECPITGHIQAVWNNNDPSGGKVYFQNVVWPVTKVDGSNGNLNQGQWAISAGTTHSLTDSVGHTLSNVVISASGDLGVQFPANCTP